MMDTETKTILHYAKKIKEYCRNHQSCQTCPLNKTDGDDCYFYRLPYVWLEVDTHER